MSTTERNFTVVVPGFYRTRGNEIAEVVQIMDPRLDDGYPARGFLQGKTAWALTGDFLHPGNTTERDLIEYLGTEKPREKKMVKKVIRHWVNVYTRYKSQPFTTRVRADEGAATGRIDCVEMTGEYEMEEEV